VFPEFAEDHGLRQTRLGCRLLRRRRECARRLREQRVLRPSTWEELVGEDHPVRVVWAYVEEADPVGAGCVNQGCRRASGTRGDGPQDPAALWMLVTIEEWGARGRSIGCAETMGRISGSVAGWG